MFAAGATTNAVYLIFKEQFVRGQRPAQQRAVSCSIERSRSAARFQQLFSATPLESVPPSVVVGAAR
jgi:hypothetical protein